MGECVHSEIYSGNRKPNAVAHIHESFGSNIGGYLVEDLIRRGLDIKGGSTKCLCSYEIGDIDFDGHEIVLLNTLNGIGDDVWESVVCNMAVKKIILRNPETHFWLMDFGDGNFREDIFGRPENLAYIRYKGFDIEDFVKDARSLRR